VEVGGAAAVRILRLTISDSQFRTLPGVGPRALVSPPRETGVCTWRWIGSSVADHTTAIRRALLEDGLRLNWALGRLSGAAIGEVGVTGAGGDR
jgi:hypothetical protein